MKCSGLVHDRLLAAGSTGLEPCTVTYISSDTKGATSFIELFNMGYVYGPVTREGDPPTVWGDHHHQHHHEYHVVVPHGTCSTAQLK